jgi:hypothetical protein
MSPRKLLVLTAVVLLLFGFIILFERKMPSTSQRQEKGDVVWEIPPDRIETIRLEHAGLTVELKQTAEEGAHTWKMTKPEAYPADAGVAGDVASQLARLRRAGNETAEASPESYGFQSPSGKVTVVWTEEGEEKKHLSRTLEIGIDIPGTDAVAARVTGTDRIFFIPTAVAGAVKKNPDEFKSKEVFGGSGTEAARLDVDRGRGRLSLSQKNGVWWITQPLSDLADGDATQRLMGDLTSLKVLDFLPAAERQKLASLGLAPPLYRITLSDAKGPGTVVDFGSTRSDGNSVYARRESQVFTVPSSITEEVSKEAVAFREPRLVRFDRARVTSLSGVFGRTSIVLEQKSGGWTAAGKPVAANAIQDLSSAISDIKSRAFLDDAEAAALGSREPSATITVKGPADDWILRFYGGSVQTRATVTGRPGAFDLVKDPAPDLQAAFQKAAVPLQATPVPKKATPKKP